MADLTKVVITPINPAGAARAFDLFGTGNLAGGGATYDTLDRDGRLSATGWVGQSPHTQTLVLVVYSSADVGLLRSWGQKVRDGVPPPQLVLAGPIELPAPWTYWVLTDIAPTSDVDTIRDASGGITQQSLSLSLLEATDAQVQLGPAAAARARAGQS